MKIRGREINFLKTVKATCDLIELCPDKDVNRIAEVFNGNVADAQKAAAVLIHTLNESYEMSKHYNEPNYEPHVISIDEIMYLTQEDFTELLNEAMEVFTENNSTVEIEKTSKKKKG